MARLFGTDGIRGKANSELTPELAFKLGKAGAYVLGKGKEHAQIIIGKDTRISGSMLEAALAAGICAMGVDVIKTGVLPTPGIAYLTRTLQADAGVVISASHNPFEDNGIKFFAGSGYKLPDEMEDEIEAVLNRLDELESPSGSRIGTIMDMDDASEKYEQFLINTAPSSLEGLKIVLDCANGAAYKIGPRVLTDLGAEVIPIFNQPNGTNINVQCGSTHPEALAKAVVESGADIGLACDGDADRIIAVDEKGQIIDGDYIMVICASALKENGKLAQDSLVVTVMSNMGLHKACRQAGIHVLETTVGDRYVMEKLKESGAVLGGEQSGHIIFLEHNTTGDGLLSGLQLLDVLKAKQMPLSELAAQMRRFPQVLLNTRVDNKDKVMASGQLKEKISEVQQHLGEDGRILVRPSGTESLIRVMLEGPDQEELASLAQAVVAVVKSIDC
ncbi:phosphoglucosamine mutase [Dehalobacter sp. DCM]|uniref:phosphoglucosamine mutase n=1 Tax=Dehalobacter sp. DCM TaxID=2907827 RepID=UPI0030819C3C|nr:phosphoglucosamine mutase [Dehalobacter sp. DCM]